VDTQLLDLVHRPYAPGDRTPAIISSDGELSYRDLWQRVDGVAELMLGAGVAPGDRIGLFLPRSADYVVSLLATWWVGATAIPLDPELPSVRITRMLDMTRPTLVLGNGDHAPTAEIAGLRWLELGTSGPGLVGRTLPRAAPPAGAPALILFTSGSTGRPKGVLLTNAGLANRLRWGQRQYRFDATDRVLHKASISFDAALHEIFAPLLGGGAIVIAPPGLQFDSLGLVRLMQQAAVTTAHFVPSLLRYVLDEDELAYCTELRRVFCGGEVLDRALLQRFQQMLPCPLFNQYGPTETSINVTFWDCREPFDGETVPIGRPIDNISCDVRDAELRSLPVGEVGELCVGGIGVGAGYLDDTAETERKFCPDPLTEGGLIYRTGDLARLAPAGYLQFHGRIDEQVKIRGVRVEPGEVAAVLREHESIVDAAVIAAPDHNGELSLVSYLAVRRTDNPVVDGRRRVPLPNGMAVVAPSPDEALFLYRQIFQEDEYARFGVTIAPGSVVVDVGANIGLFSLWAAGHAPDVRVISVEPNPDVLPYLRTNLELYGVRGEVVPMAISDGPGTAQLTSFPHLTYLSGLGEREEAAVALVRSHSELAGQVMTDREKRVFASELGDRLTGTRHTVPTADLTSLFDRYGLTQVDLLKINVEGSELAVLTSLDHGYWPRIGQVCVEVERSASVGPRIEELLSAAGFHTSQISDWSVGASAEVSYIYAVKADGGARPDRPTRRPSSLGRPLLTEPAVRAFLAERLPAAMHPRRFVFLDQLPRLPSGKVALAELAVWPAPMRLADLDDDGALADRLREIWRGALAVDVVRDEDNFVALGGHSLIAMRVSAAIREAERITVPPSTCLSAPTFLDWLVEATDSATGGDRDSHDR
jgi:amino acid adenylation domain-containing protein/FkbM family methyltransferase